MRRLVQALGTYEGSSLRRKPFTKMEDSARTRPIAPNEDDGAKLSVDARTKTNKAKRAYLQRDGANAIDLQLWDTK